MMRRAIILALLGLPSIFLIHFSERSHQALPKWPLLVSAIPFFIALFFTKDPNENMLGEASETVGKCLLLLLGVGGMVFGVTALSLRDSNNLIGLFAWILLVALVVTLVAMVRIMRK